MDCIVHGVANSRLSLSSKLIIAHTNWDWDKMSDFPWMKQNYKGEITLCFRHWEFKDPSLLPTGRDHRAGTTGRVRSLLLTLAAYWGHLECLRIESMFRPHLKSIPSHSLGIRPRHLSVKRSPVESSVQPLQNGYWMWRHEWLLIVNQGVIHSTYHARHWDYTRVCWWKRRTWSLTSWGFLVCLVQDCTAHCIAGQQMRDELLGQEWWLYLESQQTKKMVEQSPKEASCFSFPFCIKEARIWGRNWRASWWKWKRKVKKRA